MIRWWLPVLLCFVTVFALPFPTDEIDSDDSRRVLGSSVVTSVSVIMDLGNGTKKYFADAAGKPLPKPTAAALVGSPAQLLNPDRYEFYTFDESGDLVKRLMTLDEIQGIIANGEGEFPDELPLQTRPNYYHQKLPGSSEVAAIMMSDKTQEQTMDMEELSPSIPGVKDVVLSVQNVLKEELSKNKLKPPKPVVAPLPPSTISSPDSSWSMIMNAPVDQTMQSFSTLPNTAATTTMQPSKFTAATVENSYTNDSNADTTKVQTPKPITAAEVAHQTTNSSRITTPQPYKSSTVSTGSFPTASNFITTTVKPQKTSAASAELAPAASNVKNTTVLHNATSNEISSTASSLKTTIVPPQKPNITSTQSSQVVTRVTTTTAEPPKFITTSAASIIKTTNTEPQKPNATFTELFAATTNDNRDTSPQKADGTSSESSPVVSDINIATKRPQTTSTTLTQSNITVSNIRTTTVQPEQPSATSIESFSNASNGMITNIRPQKPSVVSKEPTIASSNNSITGVQTQKTTTTSPELSPTTSVVKVTTTQSQKPSVTSDKLTAVVSNVRTTTPQTQTTSATSELIPAANNVITTNVQPQKPSSTLDESSVTASYVKIATVEPKKPSVASVEPSPAITNDKTATTRPQKPSASNTESFLADSSIRITTVQPQKINNTAAEIFPTGSNTRTTTTPSQKPIVTSTEPSPAASNVISSSFKPEKVSATSNELPAVVNNVRTSTVLPEKTNVVSTLSSSAYSTIKTTTLRPHSSTQLKPADVSLKNVTVQPQNISNIAVLIANTQSLPVINKINNTTLKPEKLDTASTTISTVSASSAAVSEGKIKTQPPKSSINPGAPHRQTSMTTTIKNTSSTTTSIPTEPTNTISSDKPIQQGVGELPTTLNGLDASQPSSLAPSSHTTDRNVATTVTYNEIDSLPTSDVIAQLSDNNEVAAAQEFIKLFTSSQSSSSGLNTEENKVGSMFSKVSGQTTANTFQQSDITAASSTVATIPHYYNSATGASPPPIKTTGASIADQTASNVDTVSTPTATASSTIASSKVPLESVNRPVTLSTTVKPTTLPHLNSSSNLTEDKNMLKIEVAKIPEASTTNATPATNFSSHVLEQIPGKTETPLTTEDENSSNSEDVMAELADSLSLVLSQVGGSITTIDYGEELLLMGSSSVTDSSTIQSSVTTTTEAESNTTESHISDNMVTSQGNYDNIMNIKDIMSTAANKQQNDIQDTTENTSTINNRIPAGSFTSEVKVKSPSNDNSILKLDSSKTKENIGSEKNNHTTAEIKKPTIDRYETTTFSIGLNEELEEDEKRLSGGSTDAQNGKESNKFVVTTTEDLSFYTETTTEVVEAVTEKLINNLLKNNEDKYSNNYKKTDFESLGENSDSYSADFSESSTPTEMYQSTTIDFTTTDSTYSADFQTVASPTASSEIKLHFAENTKDEPVSEVSDKLKQSSKQNITQETTTRKTAESNTLRIQTETTIPVTDVTQEQSTENTQLPQSSTVTEVNEKVTGNSENIIGVTSTEKPQQKPSKESSPPQDILKLTANDTHKFDNKVQLQPVPLEKPSHRPPIREPSPSEDILKLGATNAHKVDNNVELQTSLHERPEHRPLTREPSPSEDILKLGPADANNNIQLQPAPQESLGLEITSSKLGEDVRRFADLCNELAFRIWVSTSGKGLTATRSLILSPFAVTSMLAMVFLGARGPTSGQMNDILRLDDMVTFNPHLVFRNVTESIASSTNSGVAIAAFVRELYSDKARGKLLDFYKERAQQFYDGHVEEVNFASIGDLVRRRTNLLVKRQTRGRIPEYVHGNNIMLRPPLAAFSANILQTDCSDASIDGRDGEMYFTVTPAMRQRRLVPVPAVVWRSGFLAGYEPGLDATAVSLGNDKSQVSVILVLPGQQGQLAPGDGLARLEARLIEASLRSQSTWSRLLRSLVARPGLELQLPRFSHRSLLNLTSSLQRMGLRDLFSAERADLRGINGLANDLHLSDIVQLNMFSTCAEEGHTGSRHHVEVFPSSSQRSGRQEEHARKLDADDLSSLPLALRPRQARLPDSKPRLRFDRPFLYFVRHNPTGLILHMGRFNPRIRH